MGSVKGNVIFNGINTVVNIILPLFTFPYAARVLLPEGIGSVNFLSAIINYIILFTSLGIPLYAVKEVARCRDDRIERNKTTLEILCLSIGLCLTGYIAVWAMAAFVPVIHRQSALFYVLSLSILFNALGVNWFYQGVEDFKYITIRSVVFKLLMAASLFIFVRNQDDLLIYAVISVGMTVGNNLINFIRLRKFMDFSSIRFSNLQILRHLRPALKIFMLNLITSLYVQLNSIMLGFISNEDEVAYFTGGTKISHIGLTVITSIGAVLLPRCSNLIKKGDWTGFRSVINNSVRFTVALSLPMMVGLMILAHPIIMLFCGPDYEPAVMVLFLNAPVILLIGLTNVIGIQILYPMNKVNLVIWSVSGGALINLILNVVLIPGYGAAGAAVATLMAEFAVLCLQLALGRRYIPFRYRNILPWSYVVGSVIMGGAVYALLQVVDGSFVEVLAGILVGILVYAVWLLIMRDKLVLEMKDFLLKKLFKS